LNKLPYCFTLQSCCGHFTCTGREDPYNTEPLPITDTIRKVEYRIAYMALCIEESVSGSMFLEALKGVTAIDPENVQFGCAEWFWQRQVNSYVVQVEPDRFQFEDRAMLAYNEALKIESVRNEFLIHLRILARNPIQ